MTCECKPTEFPFACQRHGGCMKTEHFYKLCQNRADYRELWEAGTGPCIPEKPGIGIRAELKPAKPEPPMEGLGDLVEAITKKTGVKWLVETASKFTGLKCGCKERKDLLNQLFPFRPDGLTDAQWNQVIKHAAQIPKTG